MGCRRTGVYERLPDSPRRSVTWTCARPMFESTRLSYSIVHELSRLWSVVVRPTEVSVGEVEIGIRTTVSRVRLPAPR